MKKRESQKGFSLIELMMVVAIIGVLAGVGIPQYQKFQQRAKRSEVKTLLSSMYTSQKAFFAEWNQYYADFNAVGYGLEGDLGYFVGFASTAATGPATHPNSAYRGAAATAINATIFGCTANFDANSKCNISKAKTTSLPASTVNLNDFIFGGSANLDDDPTLDQWTINQNKQFTIVTGRDDIAN